MDEIHLARPFLGVRRDTDELRDRDYPVNHKRVWRLMRKMGIEAIYLKRRTTIRGEGHSVLRQLDVELYLCAIV